MGWRFDLKMLTAGDKQIDLTDSAYIRTLIGWKFDSVQAENGDLSFDRYPLDVMFFHQTGKWSVGGGLTYHMSPKFSGSGVASGLNINFNDALGFAFEVNHQFNKMYLGGKFTVIDYELQNSSISVSGNSLGIVLGFVFGE